VDWSMMVESRKSCRRSRAAERSEAGGVFVSTGTVRWRYD
jgi:hypothetical protein